MRRRCSLLPLTVMTVLIALGTMGGALFAEVRTAVPLEAPSIIGPAIDEKADSGAPHEIEFRGGERLRGKLDRIDSGQQEISWRYPAIAAPLSFPFSEFLQLRLGAEPRPRKVRATIKFVGGDWITADVNAIRAHDVQIMLGDGSPHMVPRERIEWIHLAQGMAADCYEGPTGLEGWIFNGAWTYRDGALRAPNANPIGRIFNRLPDQVEYAFTIETPGLNPAFYVLLHNENVPAMVLNEGTVRVMLRGANLHLISRVGKEAKSDRIDLSKAERSPGIPLLGAENGGQTVCHVRLFEDRPHGNLTVFLNGYKAAEWKIGKVKAGENRGGFTVMPLSRTAASEAAISGIRVVPWDGILPAPGELEWEPARTDRVTLEGGETTTGRIESATAGQLKLRTEKEPLEVSLSRTMLIRFRQEKHDRDNTPILARIRLNGGEIQATALTVQGDRMVVRSNALGEIRLPIRAVELIAAVQSPDAPLSPADTLVLRNGDRLLGALEKLGTGNEILWRTQDSARAVAIPVKQVAGVLLRQRGETPLAGLQMLARFRNGDLWTGRLVALNEEQLVFESPVAGTLKIPRSQVRTVLFGQDGRFPATDGAAQHEAWASGGVVQQGGFFHGPHGVALSQEIAARQWRYFDGNFTSRAQTRGATFSPLQYTLDPMPRQVEFSFDVTMKTGDMSLSAQLFSSASDPGYSLQLHSSGAFLFDTKTQQQGRGGGHQQLVFSGKPKRTTNVRILADRYAGKLTLVINGVVVGQFAVGGRKPRELATAITLAGPPNMPHTFSNLWVGPWNGLVPDPASPPDSAPLPYLLLANGDETRGTVESVTSEIMKVASAGEFLDIPVARIAAIDFGDAPATVANKACIRLAGWGRVSVSSYQLVGDKITCKSDLGGELQLPLSAIREIVLPAPPVSLR